MRAEWTDNWSDRSDSAMQYSRREWKEVTISMLCHIWYVPPVSDVSVSFLVQPFLSSRFLSLATWNLSVVDWPTSHSILSLGSRQQNTTNNFQRKNYNFHINQYVIGQMKYLYSLDLFVSTRIYWLSVTAGHLAVQFNLRWRLKFPDTISFFVVSCCLLYLLQLHLLGSDSANWSLIARSIRLTNSTNEAKIESERSQPSSAFPLKKRVDRNLRPNRTPTPTR